MALLTFADLACRFRALYAIETEHPHNCAASCGTPSWSLLRFRPRLAAPACEIVSRTLSIGLVPAAVRVQRTHPAANEICERHGGKLGVPQQLRMGKFT